jgi:hypothetical protein
MLLLVNFLIIIFILLIIYQIFLAHFNSIIEGLDNNSNNNLEYKNYDSTTSISSTDLSQINFDNIKYLKQQLDSLSNIHTEVQDLSGNVSTLTTQVNGLVQQQSDYAKNNLPADPPEITGSTD